MTKTEQRSIRLTPETIRKAEELAQMLGPIKALSLADVMTECVERVHKQETKKERQR